VKFIAAKFNQQSSACCFGVKLSEILFKRSLAFSKSSPGVRRVGALHTAREAEERNSQIANITIKSIIYEKIFGGDGVLVKICITT